MYQCLNNKHKNTGLKKLNDPKAMLKYSNNIQELYKNIN